MRNTYKTYLKLRWILMIWVMVSFLSQTACSRKTGCKATENIGPDYGKDGSLKKSKTKTRLFK
ncbi:MAG TPA: hypothetical protein VJ917_08995 [Saprospiraceae bacterium]|nr:hypothetical protein [Saprospiraceae bacterium]